MTDVRSWHAERYLARGVVLVDVLVICSSSCLDLRLIELLGNFGDNIVFKSTSDLALLALVVERVERVRDRDRQILLRELRGRLAEHRHRRLHAQ